MSVLWKLTLRTLKLNPKRTLVTILGIVLATALITAVANVAESFIASMVEYEKESQGDYHYKFSGVEAENLKFFQNNQMVEKIGIKQNVGYAPLEGCMSDQTPYLFLMAMDENGMKANALKLTEGRFPQAEGEIVIPVSVGTAGGVDIKIGEVLALTIGNRMAGGFSLDQNNPYKEDEETFVGIERREFLVVGRMERARTVEPRSAPGYTAVIYLNPGEVSGEADVYATYTREGIQNAQAVNIGLLGISEEDYLKMGEDFPAEALNRAGAIAKGFSPHKDLILMETKKFSDDTSRMLSLMATLAILIIVSASIFCIRNGFAISLTEKTRLYGMLSSVGATRKQLRGLVYREALLLALIGIPIGIVCGEMATVILIHVAGGLMELSEEIRLIYKMSFPAIGAGALLSIVTIFLSAGQSAKKAGRVSPLSAIRGNEMIRIQGMEKLPSPKKRDRQTIMGRLIGKLFGIGGLIAYKNMRRSRGKYRTTVISIAVGTATFIAVSSFINIGFLLEETRYREQPWQIMAELGTAGKEYRQENYEEGVKIAGMDGVEAAEVNRTQMFFVEGDQISYNSKYRNDFPHFSESESVTMNLTALDGKGYEAYVKGLGLHPDEAWDKAIVISDYQIEVSTNGKRKIYEGEKYDFHPGDVIEGHLEINGEEKEVSVTVKLQTRVHPMSVREGNGNATLIVSDRWLEETGIPPSGPVKVYLRCKDPEAMEKAILGNIGIPDYDIYNAAAEYKSSRAFFLLVSIFLYGFIAVIVLIGVTNIFNTITTNMELRSREFAMLMSVGMTQAQLRRMVLLENIFYGGKALCFGIPIGWILYAAFYKILDLKISAEFELPWVCSLVCAAAVAVLLAGIMRYSMAKIRKKNIVETIQNENI